MPIIDKAKSDSLITAIRSWNDSVAKYRQEFEKIVIPLKK